MLEVLIIFCYIFSFRYWKLRGKTFEQLTSEQKEMVTKALKQDFWRNKKNTPETYLPKLQKSAITLFVMAIILTVFWIAVVIWLYPMLLSEIAG